MASVLSEYNGILFCENSLIWAYHPVECALNLRFPQILAKLFVPLLGASSSSHCLGHRELVYKVSVQTTPANPVLTHF